MLLGGLSSVSVAEHTRAQIPLSVARVSHGARRPYGCRPVIWVVEAGECLNGVRCSRGFVRKAGF
jgi:hypothetical protein